MSSSVDQPLWVLTGLSGAGKATALRALEAAGVRCLDNLPVELLAALVPVATPTVAVVDARQGDALRGWEATAGAVRDRRVRVLYLDARDDVLVRRLSDSLRPHPCAAAGRGLAAVLAERTLLASLRAGADEVLDTSDLSDSALGARVVAAVSPEGTRSVGSFLCTVSSFGYKYGVQAEADWVIDVRFLRNPFWDPTLRPLTGLDRAVRDYIWEQAEADSLVERLDGLLGWVISRSEAHGRSRLHVALGCTGGRHRSVAVAEELAGRLRGGGVDVVVRHRDVERPEPR